MLRNILAIALIASLFAMPARAAQLVMFESDGCFWCDRWDQEVGRYYGKTAEGRAAPLRRVNLYDRRPSDLPRLKAILATPTFVLIDNGRELGRVVGYPGKRPFWIMLSRILSRR